MKLLNEQQIMDEGFRISVIEEIKDTENIERKNESFKRYNIFKDGSKQYVIDQLKKELDKETVEEMESRTPNISFLRKIIDQKARVFKDGVQFEFRMPGNINTNRKFGIFKNKNEGANEKLQEQMDAVLDFINIGSLCKKLNKFSELFKNTSAYTVPVENKSINKWYYKVKALQPYLYDVIEDDQDPEMAMVYIFSYYSGDTSKTRASESGMRTNDLGERSGTQSSSSFTRGDGIDQTIADSPSDFGSENERYVWWSHSFHFVTNGKGQIITEDIINEIEVNTFVNFPQEQDGQFWAIGGGDLADGAITLNQLLADLFFIAKIQGNGQFFFFGKGVPKSMKVGPNRALLHEVKDKDDPEPKAGFLSSNPPLLEHMTLIEKFLVMLLTTNDLEPGTIDLKNSGATSGIQEAIKKSENIADIEDQREMYSDNLPELINIVVKWHNKLWDKKMLIPKLQEIGRIPEEFITSVKYLETPQFLSEKDKLEIIEKRRDLGLDSAIDSIMRDSPDMNRADAEKKYMIILEDELKFSRAKLLGLSPIVENDKKEEDDNGTTEGDI